MELGKEQEGTVLIVTPQGEFLDASNAEAFKRDSTTLLEGHSNVVFDMSRLQFVDSAGLGALLSCMRKLSGAGGDLKLYGLTKPVRAAFEVSRMHRIFDLYTTQEEAVKAFEV